MKIPAQWFNRLNQRIGKSASGQKMVDEEGSESRYLLAIMIGVGLLTLSIIYM